MNILDKKHALTSLLLAHSKTLFIACSGGLDSRFLAHYARDIGIQNIHLLHITGVHIDPAESNFLEKWANKNAYSLHRIHLNVLNSPNIQNNPPLRCYYCKHTAFTAMHTYIQQTLHIYSKIIIHDGTHFDDTKTHRPGLKALDELNIKSPLALAHFTKKDIIHTAHEISLESPTQKSKPCLLTRFDYNTPLTQKKLQFIAEAEQCIENILLQEFGENRSPVFRIREIKPDIYELHTLEDFPKCTLETLQSTLKQVSIKNKYKIHSFEHKILETISGYFDKPQ